MPNRGMENIRLLGRIVWDRELILRRTSGKCVMLIAEPARDNALRWLNVIIEVGLGQGILFVSGLVDDDELLADDGDGEGADSGGLFDIVTAFAHVEGAGQGWFARQDPAPGLADLKRGEGAGLAGDVAVGVTPAGLGRRRGRRGRQGRRGRR